MEALWSELSRGDRDVVSTQVLDDAFNTLDVFGELGIVCLVPLLHLLFARSIAVVDSVSSIQHTEGALIDRVRSVDKWRKSTANESFR